MNYYNKLPISLYSGSQSGARPITKSSSAIEFKRMTCCGSKSKLWAATGNNLQYFPISGNNHIYSSSTGEIKY